MEYIKPRDFMEPIHPDAPGFNPDQHRDLIEEINAVLTTQINQLQEQVNTLKQKVQELGGGS